MVSWGESTHRAPFHAESLGFQPRPTGRFVAHRRLMRALIRQAVVLGSMALTVLAPRAASAITIDQVVSLAKSGVTDTVILALIDRDRTVFAIEPEQIVSLQRDGLSERVILAMLRSGREEGEQAARADAAYNAAWIASAIPTEPLSVTVGHGPDRPNTPHVDGFYSGAPLSTFMAPPYYGPAFRYRKPPLAPVQRAARALLCAGQHRAHVQSGAVCHRVSRHNAAAPEVDFGLRSGDETP